MLSSSFSFNSLIISIFVNSALYELFLVSDKNLGELLGFGETDLDPFNIILFGYSKFSSILIY